MKRRCGFIRRRLSKFCVEYLTFWRTRHRDISSMIRSKSRRIFIMEPLNSSHRDRTSASHGHQSIAQSRNDCINNRPIALITTTSTPFGKVKIRDLGNGDIKPLFSQQMPTNSEHTSQLSKRLDSTSSSKSNPEECLYQNRSQSWNVHLL